LPIETETEIKNRTATVFLWMLPARMSEVDLTADDNNLSIIHAARQISRESRAAGVILARRGRSTNWAADVRDKSSEARVRRR